MYILDILYVFFHVALHMYVYVHLFCTCLCVCLSLYRMMKIPFSVISPGYQGKPIHSLYSILPSWKG